MNTSVERILSYAKAELGKTESPAGSNRTPYGKWYGLDGNPWCMMFIMWVFHQAGLSKCLPCKTASCGALMRAAQKSGCWVTNSLKRGDVVIYDFPGGAKTDHCGIVEEVTSGGVVAIEGNTSQSGSQSNGGQVCRKTRPFAQIVGAVRPNYPKEGNMKKDSTPSPAHKDGVEWAQKCGILIGDKEGNLNLSQPITRQQFCTMLYRFAKSIGKA